MAARVLASIAVVVLAVSARGGCQARRATLAPDPAPATRPTSAGGHTEIRVEDLPPPGVGPDTDNSEKFVQRPPGAALRLPPGFSAQPFAQGGFELPRWLALAP